MTACTVCKGEKVTKWSGFTTAEGKVYPATERECSSCRGKGEFPAFEQAPILERILATKGKNKGKIRASMTAPFGDKGDGFLESRAYYVWRMARFHGGKDMTMPMSADLIVRGDPSKNELDILSDKVAKEQFGSDLHAAARWGRAFGLV